MEKLHHAMTGTGAVAITVAAAIPGTLVHRLLPDTNGTVCASDIRPESWLSVPKLNNAMGSGP
jgi:2-methylaconitate cis-trans-isomerase PrpF